MLDSRLSNSANRAPRICNNRYVSDIVRSSIGPRLRLGVMLAQIQEGAVCCFGPVGAA